MRLGKVESDAIREIGHLLFWVPENFSHDRLARGLMAAGGKLTRFGTGLKMTCRGADWKAILIHAAGTLSSPERHDIRVAVVPIGKRSGEVKRALFSTRRLDELLSQLYCDWLPDLLDRDAISVLFQPLIQQPPGRLHGYECLAQGVDDAGRPIPPTRLFSAARELDLLNRLDSACRVMAIKTAAELGLGKGQLFINFVPGSIYNPQTCFRATIAAVEEAGLNPASITFEAVQLDQSPDRRHLAEVLRYCQSRGFKVALDNVGADSASMVAILEIRPDYLKLDGATIRKAADSAAEARQVRNAVEAARQRGIIAVATGVETPEQLRFAFGVGLRITQGFFYAPPAGKPLDAQSVKTTIARAREEYGRCNNPGGSAAPKPWDIVGLYKKLTSLARPVASEETRDDE